MPCEGYGLGGGNCYGCPINADCQTRNEGFDVVAIKGHWRGQARAPDTSQSMQFGLLADLCCLQPFVESCISNNTIEILRSNGAWQALQLQHLEDKAVAMRLCAAIVTSPEDKIAQTSGQANIYKCPGA